MELFTIRTPYSLGLFLGSLLTVETAIAQDGAGSSTLDNGYRTSAPGDITYEYSETLYIGPNAVWNISGTHIIYSKYIWIAPTAQIEQNGVGSLVIANPDDNPFYPDMTGATTIDGNNGNPIGSIVSHQNPNNIILADITDPGYGTANPSGALAAALHIGNNFNFDINDGDVLLNGNDFITSGTGNLSGYSANRMVVTGNSITGHLVRLNGGNNSATYFPVGIAEGDYTPAGIQGANDYHVSVTDYAASGATINVPQEGMDRAWHIYGGSATTLELQHNTATNGSQYTDAAAFITRYQGSGEWSTGTPEQTGTGQHSNSGTTAAGIPAIGTDDGVWLTKTSDAMTPLPVKLISFDVFKMGNVAELIWATASEQNNKGFDIERSIDGHSWSKIGFVNSLAGNGNSDARLDYKFVDNVPAKNQNYYRLKQVDIDGNHEYSRVRTVWFNEANKITVYPNPVRGNLVITGLKGLTDIRLLNAQGQTVKIIPANAATTTLVDMSGLASGIYIIRTMDDTGKSTSYKIIKK